MALAAFGFAFLGHKNVQKQRAKIKADFARLKEQSAQALRAVLAEIVEWRRDWTMRDGMSAEVAALLQSITPEQHLLAGHNTARRVMAQAA